MYHTKNTKKMSKKLAISLGLREKLEKDFQNMISDMISKFKKKQGLFQGVRNTFVALEGHPDIPEQRKTVIVGSTVREQLNWFKQYTKDYFDTVLSIEKTNAGGVMGELVVNGTSWGTYSTLELLRLKGILDGKLRAMKDDLPIRSEGVLWEKTMDPVYDGREVYETEPDEGFTKTTLKRTIIVEDPHIKDTPGRPPVTQNIDTPVNTGKYSRQDFSGAITNRQKADFEVNFNHLYKGVVAALEDANSAPLIESDLGDKVLGYLFK